MDSRKVKIAVHAARLSSMVLAVVVVFMGAARPYLGALSQTSSFRFMLVAMWFEIIWGVLEFLQAAHLIFYGAVPIPTSLLTVMVMVNMVLMCCTWGMSNAALSTALFVRHHHLCASTDVCKWFIVVAVLAIFVGASRHAVASRIPVSSCRGLGLT
uniref:Uncharacterized protein n=1 Tax=Oryza brachyantha TaxID=4533 RepID=J3L2Z0_ORYBR